MDLSFEEQLSILIHDLTGSWGVICASTDLLKQGNLSPADIQLFEDIISRNILKAQFILIQLRGYLSQEGLLIEIKKSLEEFKLERSANTATQLASLFLELSQSISDTNSNKTISAGML